MGRVPRRGEPWFLEEDTDAVLEWQRAKDSACPGCGLPREETMDKQAHDRYTTSVVRCHACAAVDRKRDLYQKQFGDAPGTFIVPIEIR